MKEPAAPSSSSAGDPRIALAAERTLLAWMRSGLSLMAFGFVVARFGLLLRELTNRRDLAETGAFSRFMGMSLVLLGVVVLGAAAIQHGLRLSDPAEATDGRRRVSGWIAVSLTGLLAVLGVVMAGYLALVR